MPTPVLSLNSPYFLLFRNQPNYTKLKIFGCQCLPWLRPYRTHKLQTRSTPCVFLGYSSTQSAYLCFDPSTNRLFVSRHVRFDEHTFPFPSLSAPIPTAAASSTTWITPVTVVTSPLTSPSSSTQSAPLSTGLSPTNDEVISSPTTILPTISQETVQPFRRRCNHCPQGQEPRWLLQLTILQRLQTHLINNSPHRLPLLRALPVHQSTTTTLLQTSLLRLLNHHRNKLFLKLLPINMR